MRDFDAHIGWQSDFLLGVKAGYSRLEVELDDVSGLDSDLEIGGPYLAPRKALFQGFANSGAFCVLRGAGHWVMYERPAEFGDLLLGALADSE